MSPSPILGWLVDNAVWLCAGTLFGLLLLACYRLARITLLNHQLETALFHARQTSAFWKGHCRAQTQRLAIRKMQQAQPGTPPSPPEVKAEVATLPSLEAERVARLPEVAEMKHDAALEDTVSAVYDAGPWDDEDDITQPFLLENCKTHVWAAPEPAEPANDAVPDVAGDEK